MGRTSGVTKAKRSASDVQRVRSEAIAQMNPRLLQVFRQMEEANGDQRSQNIRYWWNGGRQQESIRAEPEVYGRDAITLLERAMSTQARTMRKAAAFYRAYTEAQVDELIGLYNTETGYTLHWGHVTYLLSLSTPEQRLTWSKEAVSKLWEPPALHAAMKKRLKRTAGHGRKHKMPATVEAQIRQQLVFTQQWLAKQKDVWNGEENNIFTNVINTPGEDITEELVTHLRELQEALGQLEVEARDTIASAQRALEHAAAQLAVQRRIEEDVAQQAQRAEEARVRANTSEPAPEPVRRTRAPGMRQLDTDSPTRRVLKAAHAARGS